MDVIARAAGAALLLLFASPAAADQDEDPRGALPERPSVATHAYTVAPGIAEIEAGYERTREEGRFGDSPAGLAETGPGVASAVRGLDVRVAASSGLDSRGSGTE